MANGSASNSKFKKKMVIKKIHHQWVKTLGRVAGVEGSAELRNKVVNSDSENQVTGKEVIRSVDLNRYAS